MPARAHQSHVRILMVRQGTHPTNLRQFLMAKDKSATRYRFRFYDPRVLRADVVPGYRSTRDTKSSAIVT